jgi:NAD(P)H-flavin reductase
MIIYINKKKYDITEFLKEHPGGADVFKDGEDMTEAFNEVEHSKEAIKMLESYLVKEETDEEELGEEKEEKRCVDLNVISIQEFILFKFKQTKFSRLFSKEDKANIHKILGSFALLNYAWFFFDLYYSGCKGKMTLRKKDSNFIFSILPLIILSLSGLMFHAPLTINKISGGMPREYQYHSVIFALRSLIIVIILCLFGKNKYTTILIICILFATMKSADIVSKNLKDPNDKLGSKVRSIPYWTNCPVYLRDIIKDIYSFAQLLFTAWAFNADVEIHIAVAFVIQFTAFLFTLLRKGFISVKWWHLIYLLEYVIVAVGWIRSPQIYIQFLIGLIVFHLRTKLNINKYTLWSVYGLIFMFVKYSNKTGASSIRHLVLLVTLLTIMNSKDMIFDKKRPDANNRVVNNQKHHNHHHITVKMANDFDFHPGQYFNLFVDTEKRPYTPINVKEQTLEFLIKNYKNGAISPKICKYYCNQGDVNVLGPFGNKYYVPDKDTLMINGSEIQTQNILMFCCGTGITPFYSILSNLSPNTKYQMKLFCSFKSKKESFLIDNLPIKPKLFLSDINNKIDKVQIQKILKKYIPEKTCILICGTENYQKMVQTTVKTQSNNFKVFHW